MADVPVSRRRRALLSVTDKSQLEHIAVLMNSFEYELIASGGTATYLREHGFTVTAVGDLTGYPEIFGGRVKTLHPAVHGGILGPTIEAFAETEDMGIAPIDVVVVNLYRFEDAVARQAAEAETVEQIDIGGPALLRAAAKNYGRVTVLSDPAQYEEFLHELRFCDGDTSLAFRRRLAAAAFRRVADYNAAIADWFARQADSVGAPAHSTGVENVIPLRYGENPHQSATLELPAAAPGVPPLAAVGLTRHGGKELSYNNIVDLVAAVKLVCDFDQPCCGVIKHTNPCGFGLGDAVLALERALMCDPVSAFGGVFAFNGEVQAQGNVAQGAGHLLTDQRDDLGKGDVLVVPLIGLGRGREQCLGQALGTAQSPGQSVTADRSVLLIGFPARAGDVTADHALHRKALRLAYQHRTPAQGFGVIAEGLRKFPSVRRDQVIGKVREALHPGQSHDIQDHAPSGHDVIHDHVEGRNPISGYDQIAVAQVEHVAHLAGVIRLQSQVCGIPQCCHGYSLTCSRRILRSPTH